MNLSDYHRNLLTRAAIIFGRENREDHAIEEMAECMQAIMHIRRGRCDDKHVAEEIADAIITLLCAAEFHGSAFQEQLELKMQKLEHLVQRAKQ